MMNALVFGSGGGSNFKAIFSCIKSGKINLNISCVISNNSGSGILSFADENELDAFHLSQLKLPNKSDYEQEYHNLLEKYNPDIIILAGYMKMIPVSIIQKMEHKILNIHPSLLPSFGGEGMYGMNVHEAVKNAGVKISGASVHFVTEVYDEGPIVLQSSVELSGEESAEEIASLVLNIEHQLYPEAVEIVVNGDFTIENNQVILLDRENT